MNAKAKASEVGMKFISDDSHGWLAVSLEKFPKAFNFGTGFGYIDDFAKVIYLEEDYEASQFLKSVFGDDVVKIQEIPEEVVAGQAFVREFPNNQAVFNGNN